MPSASILLRLSKQAGDTNLSLSGMETDCRALAERHGYDIHAVRIDDGISGSVRDRPGFVAWLEDGRSGAADCLISWSGDRLTREGVNAAALVLDVLEGKDAASGAVTRRPVRLLTADDRLDSSGDDEGFRLNFVFKAEIARGERKRIVSRNQATQRRLRGEVGRFRGGEPPYGYAKAPREGGGWTLVLDPAESAIVRAVSERVLAGESLYAVAADLTRRNVPTRRGGPWRIPTLQSILTGPHAGGYVRHKGQVVRGEDGLPLRWFEPVLDDGTLAQLRTIVRPPSAKRHGSDSITAAPPSAGRQAKVTRFLSGLVVSACCDGTLYAVKASPTKPRPIYRQPQAAVGSCGRQVSINAEPLEAHVEAEFLRRFGHYDEVRPVREADERADLATVEREIQDVARALAEPKADLSTLTGQLSALHARRDELAERPDVGTVRMEPTGRTVGQAWTDGSTQSRRALLADFLTGSVVVSPVGRARAVKTIDADRVAIPWRAGHVDGSPDYMRAEDFGPGESSAA